MYKWGIPKPISWGYGGDMVEIWFSDFECSDGGMMNIYNGNICAYFCHMFFDRNVD